MSERAQKIIRLNSALEQSKAEFEQALKHMANALENIHERLARLEKWLPEKQKLI